MSPLTRRSFLLATAGAALAGACGGDDGGVTAAGSSTTTGPASGGTGSGGSDSLNLVQFFDRNNVIAGTQRLTFGIGDAEGIPISDVPDTLTARITREGEEVATVTAERRGQGLPRPYFPFMTELGVGTYELAVDLDRVRAPAAFAVVETAPLMPPRPGEKLVPVETPTIDDPRGVTPICTQEEICPLHEVPLSVAMTEERPVALLIATPAFCQTAVCGPVLDVLLSHRDRMGDRVRMVHAEVYVNPDESLTETTEAVQAYRLPFEPVLFLARADGTIAARLDNIFDEVEVGEALDALVSA